MGDAAYDYAVLGATPLSYLLAGLLAGTHGKSVILIGRPPSPLLPIQGIDLSVAPVTRPETWALLRSPTAELVSLLATIDRRLSERVEPHFTAQSPAGVEALSHMRHVAAGYGYALERLATRSGILLRARDAILLDRRRCNPVLPKWCQSLMVHLAEPDTAVLNFRRDGTLRLEVNGRAAEAQRAILADDGDILACLRGPNPEWLVPDAQTSILTEPLTRPEPLTIHADTGITAVPQPGGALAMVIPGNGSEATSTAGSVLREPTRIAGRSTYGRVVVRDGGPFVGPLRNPRATVIAGFGMLGAFMSPALARHLAGVATETEAAYFAAREGSAARGYVSDWFPAVPEVAAT